MHARGLTRVAQTSEIPKNGHLPSGSKFGNSENLPALRGRDWYKIRKLREVYQSLMRKIRKLRELRSGKYSEIPNIAHPCTAYRVYPLVIPAPQIW